MSGEINRAVYSSLRVYENQQTQGENQYESNRAQRHRFREIHVSGPAFHSTRQLRFGFRVVCIRQAAVNFALLACFF